MTGSPINWNKDRITPILTQISGAVTSWTYQTLQYKPTLEATRFIERDLEKAAEILDELILDVQHTIIEMEDK